MNVCYVQYWGRENSQGCIHHNQYKLGFPGGALVKNPPANAGDAGQIPESERSPRGGNGNPLQYSFLGNYMNR